MSTVKYYYLLDTCALIPLFDQTDPFLSRKIEKIFEQRFKDKAFIYMPNFCIAEVFNTFAKLRYRKEKISDEVYKTLKDKFRDLIKGGKVIYHYELSRYHILNVDYIVAFEHQFKIHSKKFLSTFDILIISMGIELVRIHGDKNFYIVTNDERISSFCKNLRKLSSKKRSEFGIPEYIIYPQVIYLKEDEIPSLS